MRHGLCGDYAADSPQKYLVSGSPTAIFSPGAVVTFEVTVTAPVCYGSGSFNGDVFFVFFSFIF